MTAVNAFPPFEDSTVNHGCPGIAVLFKKKKLAGFVASTLAIQSLSGPGIGSSSRHGSPPKTKTRLSFITICLLATVPRESLARTVNTKHQPSFLTTTSINPGNKMSSFFAQIMEPGGGVKLLPFVRAVIALLFVLTVVGAIVGVARIHMVILSFLSAGLLASLSFFESEYTKLKSARAQRQQAQGKNTVAASGKTD